MTGVLWWVQALQGVLDDQAWSQFQDARAAGNSLLETGNLGEPRDVSLTLCRHRWLSYTPARPCSWLATGMHTACASSSVKHSSMFR